MTIKKTYVKPLLKNLGLLREFIMDGTIPCDPTYQATADNLITQVPLPQDLVSLP